MNRKATIVLIYTSALALAVVASHANATALKSMSTSDRVIEDLNFPDRPNYDAFTSEKSNAPLIAQTRTALSALIEAEQFTGSGCDDKAAAFQTAPKGKQVTSILAMDTKSSAYRFSLKPKKRTDYSTSTFVRTSPDQSSVLSYTTATCEATKVFGLVDRCVVTSFCKVKSPEVDSLAN